MSVFENTIANIGGHHITWLDLLTLVHWLFLTAGLLMVVELSVMNGDNGLRYMAGVGNLFG